MVRRKNPPWFRVFSTLLQTGAGSKKIEGKSFRTRPKVDFIAPGELFFAIVTKAEDANV
jgi:hypothetical protein